MNFFNASIIVLILLGSGILLASGNLTRELFSKLTDKKQTEAWKKLRLLMIFFFVGYLFSAGIVLFNSQHLLSSLTGIIFLFGSIFVYLVVKQSLITLTLLKDANNLLEKRVLERTTELAEKNKELEQFVYIASHDLKEPIRTINSFATLLEKQEKLDTVSKTYVDFIKGSTMRMMNLTNGLLDLSKIGKNPKIDLINTKSIIEDISVDISSLINTNNAKISFENLPEIYGNRIEIRLLFQNLITNAIKFKKTEIAPEINISCKEFDDKFHFYIQDNGIGIKESDLSKVFEIFNRVDTSIEGTGIGLAHCQKIVKIHGGNIGVDSVFGQGSTFHFTILKKDI